MIAVHFRNQQRNVGLHAVVARVADDGVSCLRECALDLAGDRRVETGENEPRRASRRRGVDVEIGNRVGKRRRETPRTGVAVLLACGALARAEPCDAEPRMVREQSNELLADHSGRAKDADFYPLSLHVLRGSKKKPTRREPCRLRDGSVETGCSALDHTATRPARFRPVCLRVVLFERMRRAV